MKKFEQSAFISEGEELIYSGAPTKKLYPVFQIIIFLIVFIGVTVSDGFLVGATVFKSIAGQDNLAGEIVLYATAFLLHIIPLVFWALYLINRVVSAKSTYFVITDKRASIIKIGEKTLVETVFYSDADDIKCVKNGIAFTVKEEKFVLKYIENDLIIFDKIKDKILK